MYDENYEEDDDIKQSTDERIKNFIEGIGATMLPPPAIDSWKSMKEQIRSGYYSNVVEKQPDGVFQTNMFRAAILHGRDDDNKAAMMLNIKMIMQTVSEEMFSANSGGRIDDILVKDRKRLEEYAKSGEFKKQILNFAVPEKYLDSQREIHLKYSRSSDVKISMRGAGSIVAQVSFVFGVRTRPWTEARGEYLVENFNQLTRYTADKLERVGLSMVFDVVPERAAEVYPEEAKRLVDVDNMLNDLGLDEGAKSMKQKLDRKYLTSLILEVLNESNEEDELLRKLKDLFYTGDPADANQALEFLIDFGMISEPNTRYVTGASNIFMVFDSREELQQFIDILNEFGINEQVGSNPPRPTYFISVPLIDGAVGNSITLKL